MHIASPHVYKINWSLELLEGSNYFINSSIFFIGLFHKLNISNTSHILPWKVKAENTIAGKMET